jgi:hypothetical protein
MNAIFCRRETKEALVSAEPFAYAVIKTIKINKY